MEKNNYFGNFNNVDDQYFYDLAKEYDIRRESYDRIVYSPDGTDDPISERASTRNALSIKNELIERARKKKNISEKKIWSEIKYYLKKHFEN